MHVCKLVQKRIKIVTVVVDQLPRDKVTGLEDSSDTDPGEGPPPKKTRLPQRHLPSASPGTVVNPKVPVPPQKEKVFIYLFIYLFITIFH